MNRLKLVMWCIVPFFLLLAAGCGSSDSSSPTTVSGVAAAGSPITGTVSLKDASVPAKELSAPINADGSFSFSLDGLTPPYLLKASGTANHTSWTLYSLSPAGGTANINPLSSLVVALAHNSDNLDSLYSAPDPLTLRDISHALGGAVRDVQTALRPTLEKFGAVAVNFITDPYVANHQGLDLMLDLASISSVNGIVTMVDLTAKNIVQSSLSGFTSGSYDFITNPETTTGNVCIIPGVSSIMTGSSLMFHAFIVGSQEGNFSWSVVEDGGGSITSDGIYTAPEQEGTYHVKATSMADPGKSSVVPVTVREPANIVTIVPAGPGVFTVMARNFVDIGGVELEITYDTTSLANPRIVPGALTAQTMFVPNPQFRPNMVKLAFMSLRPIAGSGSLATITFDLLGPAPGSVSIVRTILASSTGSSVPASGGGTVPAPVPSAGPAQVPGPIPAASGSQVVSGGI